MKQGFILAIENNSYILIQSVGKSRNIIIFAFICVSESLVLLNGDFSMNSYTVL
jgi:hypothetical protein